MPVKEQNVDRAFVNAVAPNLDEDDVRMLNKFLDYTDENGDHRSVHQFASEVLGVTDEDKIQGTIQNKVKNILVKPALKVGRANGMTIKLNWPRFKRTGGGGRPSKNDSRICNAMAEMLFRLV